MLATFSPPKSASTSNKPLWAVVGVLGVAVLAMGAALIHIQTRPEEPRLSVLSTTAPGAGPVPALPVDSSPAETQLKAAALANQTPSAAKSAATKADKPMSTTAPAATVNQAAGHVTKPICANCGTVESVTAIQRDGTAGGIGAVTGGVLGAVVGNQVGAGNGKTLATILGAVGGGIAGNTVEKKMKKITVYQVQVHMEDGSTRTMEQATPTAVGAKVIVQGNSLQAASR